MCSPAYYYLQLITYLDDNTFFIKLLTRISISPFGGSVRRFPCRQVFFHLRRNGSLASLRCMHTKKFKLSPWYQNTSVQFYLGDDGEVRQPWRSDFAGLIEPAALSRLCRVIICWLRHELKYTRRRISHPIIQPFEQCHLLDWWRGYLHCLNTHFDQRLRLTRKACQPWIMFCPRESQYTICQCRTSAVNVGWLLNWDNFTSDRKRGERLLTVIILWCRKTADGTRFDQEVIHKRLYHSLLKGGLPYSSPAATCSTYLILKVDAIDRCKGFNKSCGSNSPVSSWALNDIVYVTCKIDYIRWVTYKKYGAARLDQCLVEMEWLLELKEVSS